MYIDGSTFNDPKRVPQCYLPIFSTNQYEDTWILGNFVMSQYYMVFDQAPADERKQDFIQVGLAERAAFDFIGKGMVDMAQEMFE